MPPNKLPFEFKGQARSVCSDFQSGFTLLEALVAITIVGVTFSLILAGLSGVGRTSARANEHMIAHQLAVFVLDQFETNQLDQVNDADDLIYRGVRFGYKLKFDTLEDTDSFPLAALRSGRRLKNVRVEVFWGEQPNLQSYVLSTILFR